MYKSSPLKQFTRSGKQYNSSTPTLTTQSPSISAISTNMDSLTQTPQSNQQSQTNAQSPQSPIQPQFIFYNDNSSSIKFTGCSDKISIHDLINTVENIFLRQNITDDERKLAIFDSHLAIGETPAREIFNLDTIRRDPKWATVKSTFLRHFGSSKCLIGGLTPLLLDWANYNRTNDKTSRIYKLASDISGLKQKTEIALKENNLIDDNQTIKLDVVLSLLAGVTMFNALNDNIFKLARGLAYQPGSDLATFVENLENKCLEQGQTIQKGALETMTLSSINKIHPTNHEYQNYPSTNNTSYHKFTQSQPSSFSRSRPINRNSNSRNRYSSRSLSHSRNRNNFSRPRYNNFNSISVLCFYCGFPNHTVNNCNTRQIEYREKNQGNTPYCRRHKNYGHWTNKCLSVQSDIQSFQKQLSTNYPSNNNNSTHSHQNFQPEPAV